MNSIITLTTLLALYYYIYQNYYDKFEEKYHTYFYIFIALYLVILYIYHFEYEFFYLLLRNVYDTDKKPMYGFNNINAELFESQHPNFNIKETLLQKQSGRCHACSNFIMNGDLNNTKLKYKTSLQNGGHNNVENIGLVCGQCGAF